MQATVLAKLSLDTGSRRTRSIVPLLSQELIRLGLAGLPALLPLERLRLASRPEPESEPENKGAPKTRTGKGGPVNPHPPQPWVMIAALLLGLVLGGLAEKA